MTLRSQVEQTNNKLNILPEELEKLRKKANFLKLKSGQKPSKSWQSELQQTEFELDSLVDDLDRVLIDLVSFDGKIKNIIALKERLEAIQEERIDGLTPERIYKLLEKQRVGSPQADNNSRGLAKHTNNYRQKLIALGNIFRRPKIAVSIAILASLSLGWIAGYHSSMTNVRLNNDKAIEAMQESNNSAVNL
ncbi:MAG: hypothetical protein ACFCU5_03525 [Pleurocapsa sp.]